MACCGPGPSGEGKGTDSAARSTECRARCLGSRCKSSMSSTRSSLPASRRSFAMSSGGLSKARVGRLSDVLHGYVERGEVAGVVALLSRHDEVHVETIGAADLDTGAPVRRDTVFRIASMTKPIAAAAAMILVEEAVLRLGEAGAR